VERAEAFARELRRVNESAYRSFCEGLEEILVPLLIKDRELKEALFHYEPVGVAILDITIKDGKGKTVEECQLGDALALYSLPPTKEEFT
jgi:hypothetical protein